MLELGVKILVSYFIGSVMGSIVIGALKGGVDIRTMGSGNAGGTNALRTQGVLFALGVIIIDIGKGAIGAGVVLTLPIVAEDPAVPRALLVYSCAAAAVAGHVWPMWHRFSGGKGAATLVGTIAVLAPVLLLPSLAVWVLMLVLFGYVGLATMSAAIAAPLYLVATGGHENQPLFAYTIALSLYVVYTHRSNIQRMREGTETHNPRVTIFRRGGS